LRIVVLVVIGWIAGMSAKLLWPGKSPGFVATTLIGIGGALIAVLTGRSLGWWHPGDAPASSCRLPAQLSCLLYIAFTTARAPERCARNPSVSF
jgi:uncharacterized membrane protein YeaQ/YmgE (transglycosylase-associated protein family)